MGHEAGHVAVRVRHPGDRPQRAVRIRLSVVDPGGGPIGVGVAEEDPSLRLEAVEGRLVGVEAALAVGDRQPQRPSIGQGAGERAVEAFRDDPDVAAEEAELPVAEQGPRHQAGLRQHLEAVAHPEHEAAVGGEPRDGAHDRAEPGDHPRPEVVAVGEAAREDDSRDSGEVDILVPQRHRLGAGEPEAVLRVGIAVAAREDHDADTDGHRGASAPPAAAAAGSGPPSTVTAAPTPSDSTE